MLELLRGPKGSITEGLIPFFTYVLAVLWLCYAVARSRRRVPIEFAVVLGTFLLIIFLGISITVMYSVYLSAHSPIFSHLKNPAKT